MLHPFTYCPKCDGLRSMSVSIGFRKNPDPTGELKEILVQNYHCDECQSFVCQEPVDGDEDKIEVAFFEMQASIYPH